MLPDPDFPLPEFPLKFPQSRINFRPSGPIQFELMEVPMWTKPEYIEIRLGFESTMYVSNR